MARRQRLSEAQIAELFDPPTEQRELVRHFTLSRRGLAAILRCRGDHNRLGYALMLCYLRYPGRAAARRRAAARSAARVRRRTDRRFPGRRSTTISRRSGTGSATPSSARSNSGFVPSASARPRELTDALLPQAIEDDRLGSSGRTGDAGRAGNGGSSFRRPPRSSGSAPSFVTMPAGKCIAG